MNGWLSRLLVSHREGAPDRLQPHPPRQTHNLKKKGLCVSSSKHLHLHFHLHLQVHKKNYVLCFYPGFMCFQAHSLFNIKHTQIKLTSLEPGENLQLGYKSIVRTDQ